MEYWDGTVIKQFQNGTEIMWGEINTSQIKKLSWVKKTLFGTKTKATINLGLCDTPEICRRTHIGMTSDGKETGRKMEYLLGKNGKYTIKLE